MKKILLYTALALIVFAGLYAKVIAPRQTIRIPEDWSFEAEYLGDVLYIDPDQQIPDKPMVNVYRRTMEVVEWSRNQAVIEDIYETRDVYTGQVTWSTTLHFNVNPKNGAILSYPGHPEAEGTQYIMPRNTVKTNYTFFNYTLWPFTLSFDREDVVNGLPIYVFSYKGLIDFTELTKLAQYSDELQVMPDNVMIHSPDYYTEIWVEPRTGEIVHMEDTDPGDYWVDAGTGKNIQLAAIWSGSTTGNTDMTLINRAKIHLLFMDFHQRWIPILLFGLGCSFLASHIYLRFSLNKPRTRYR